MNDMLAYVHALKYLDAISVDLVEWSENFRQAPSTIACRQPHRRRMAEDNNDSLETPHLPPRSSLTMQQHAPNVACIIHNASLFMFYFNRDCRHLLLREGSVPSSAW